MTLEEFVDRLNADVREFRDRYKEGHDSSSFPDQWPLEMDEESWFEQWIAHIN